jgi:hypothetical protein
VKGNETGEGGERVMPKRIYGRIVDRKSWSCKGIFLNGLLKSLLKPFSMMARWKASEVVYPKSIIEIDGIEIHKLMSPGYFQICPQKVKIMNPVRVRDPDNIPFKCQRASTIDIQKFLFYNITL